MTKPANMPSYVYESIQRQYGRGSGGYTIEDKKNVINWHKKQANRSDKFNRDPRTQANIS